MDKLYNTKTHINTSKIIGSCLVCFMLLGLAAYGVYFNNKAVKSEQVIQTQYKRTLTDMTDYVAQAENYLLKAMAAGTPGTVSVMLEHAAKCSAQAESCLAALPVDQHVTEKISNYLVQLGDISECWSHRATDGGRLTDDEYETLCALYGYAQDLSGVIYSLGSNLDGNAYAWNKIDKNVLKRVSEPFTDYPKLSYNGKFSSNTVNAAPKGLTGYDLQREACRGKAIRYFSKICSCPAEDVGVEYCGENENAGIETYCFKLSCPEGMTADVDVTKKGGLLYSLMISRKVGSANLSPEQGIEAGKSFLKSIGITNMKENSYSADEDSVTVTYSYEKNNVTYYPDTVKVKIALDNGMPIAYEGHLYLSSHYESKNRISKPSISEKDAREMLSSHLKVDSVREVVVPYNYGGEYHAYEFKGTVSGHPVLVYVDADNGTESDIMLIYEDDSSLMSV